MSILALVVCAQCPNPSAENGDFTGWKGYKGTHSPFWGAHSFKATGLPSPSRFEIMTPGFDPKVPSIPTVTHGNYSIKLGDSETGSQADRLVMKFVVTPNNRRLSFCYSLLLQDPKHKKKEQPYFRYRITGPYGIITQRKIVADSSDKYFETLGGINYKNWDCVCGIDLTSYIGREIEVEFTVVDCTEGGHFGYAYIDAYCIDPYEAINPAFTLQKDEYCINTPIVANGAASQNELRHFWSIEESDANWGRPNPAGEKSMWFDKQQAGTMDIEALYRQLGGTWKCNTYYRVKLAVSNSCTPWKETVKLIKVTCPDLNLLPDQCCTSALNGRLGVSSNPTPTTIKYDWEPDWAFYDPDTPNPAFNVLRSDIVYPFTFKVTATDTKGCALTKSGAVYCGAPEFEIKREDTCCGTNLSAVGTGIAKYKWSTGETTPSVTVTTPGSYTITASNPCGSTTKSVSVQNAPTGIRGPFPKLIYPRSFTPNGDGRNDVFIVYPFGDVSDWNPYNATAYKLTVWDRGGQEYVVAEKKYSETFCEPLKIGEIKWDGRINGRVVPEGVYTWRLMLRNCANTSDYFVRHEAELICDKTKWKLFCTCRKCVDWHYQDLGAREDSVKVIR